MHQEKLTILTLAIHNEQMGQEFYAEAARRSFDEQGRKMFNHLADMEASTDPNASDIYARLMQEENEHYRVLQETHAHLSANETWWDDWQKPFFTG